VLAILAHHGNRALRLHGFGQSRDVG
jgi:hypothetical protein